MACIFITILSFSFFSVYKTVTHANKDYVVAISDAGNLNRFKQKIQLANNSFSQAIILSYINENPSLITSYKNEALTNISDAGSMIKAIQTDIESRKDKAFLDEVIDLSKKLTAYKQGVVESLDILEMDIGSLPIFLPSAVAEFANVSKAVDDLVILYDEVANNSQKQAETIMEDGQKTTIIFSVIAILLTGGVGILLGQSIARPIRVLTNTMNKLADGNYNTEVPYIYREDELGEIAKTVDIFKNNSLEMKNLQQQQKESEIHAAEERKKVLHKMADSFETKVKSLVQELAEQSQSMNTAAKNLLNVAATLSSKGDAASSASEMASSNVSNMAAAIEELSMSIGSISSDLGQANEISKEAVDGASTTDIRIKGLSDAVATIGDVVELIKSIAGQTNLLALNATIEAARAGEAGKGFAVVAGEVKNLASQTTKATEEISNNIEAVQKGTAEAVESIANIVQIIQKINEMSIAISGSVQQQDSAAKSISLNVTQAAQGTKDVSSNVTSVSEAAYEVKTVSEKALASSTSLLDGSKKLLQDVDSFIKDIRNG